MEIYLRTLFHYQRVGKYLIDVSLIVASKLLVDGVVEVGNPSFLHAFTVVFEQCDEYFLFRCLIPGVGVVIKFHVLLALFLLRSLYLHAESVAQSPCSHFRTAVHCL